MSSRATGAFRPMRISHLHLQHFKRFTELTVEDLPGSARLIVLAGPNGSGKSSLFDAFVIWRGAQSGGWRDDQNYYRKGTTITVGTAQRVTVNFHDDHAAADVATFKAGSISVLGRRHIESYLYDDDVLTALCDSVGKPAEALALIAEKQKAIADSIGRGNPTDDVKSAAGEIYAKAKVRLGLTAVGNDQRAFARSTLAPLIKPGMPVYEELRTTIFGP
jgi:hypothetical protein